MRLVLTYDVFSQHIAVKKFLIEQYGYEKTLTGQSKVVSLPNTTLFHQDRTLNQAADDIKTAASSCGTVLEKFAAFLIQDYSGWIANDPA